MKKHIEHRIPSINLSEGMFKRGEGSESDKRDCLESGSSWSQSIKEDIDQGNVHS